MSTKQTAIKAPSISEIDKLGEFKKPIPVSISVHFLEQFSEQLYSSPNKAFEELLANSWDANARSAYIYLPSDVLGQDAAFYVLDDGDSMDDRGLEDLWKVSYSNKATQATTSIGRAMIGKFGIGKLATFVLANKLTYICKAADGLIRAVTMNYGGLGSGADKLLLDVNLELRQISERQLRDLLQTTPDGKTVYDLISKAIPAPSHRAEWDDEFGAPKTPNKAKRKTWTLVVLSALKPLGQHVKRGIVRRMIQTSMPLGAELNIVMNGEPLASTKSAFLPAVDWKIGPELGLSEIELPPREGAEGEEQPEQITIQSHTTPYPYVEIEGIGRITGRVKLFDEKISGGKSEEHGPSNGFFVNVRGRVTNTDSHFGETNLSHSAWSRFRMTVRADGLSDFLAVTREQFRDHRELRVFRAFLRACFNKMRVEWEKRDKWADSGAAIIERYGMLPLLSLRNFVEDLASDPAVRDSSLVDVRESPNLEQGVTDFKNATKNDLREVLKGVEFENLGENLPAVKYSLKRRTVLINRDHPLVREHSDDKAEKEALRDMFLVDVLSDGYAYDVGIESAQLEDLRQRRDRIARQVAKINRRSGAQIASLLVEVSHHSNYRPLEIIVGDALAFLGFDITHIGGSGEPEGIAEAKLLPGKEATPQAFSFTYDAKSTTHDSVQTGNCNVAALAVHRDRYNADHVLLVGPNFQAGLLDEQCKANRVTPIKSADLAELLILSAEYGAIPLTKLREIFDFSTPEDVTQWVQDLKTWLEQQRKMSLGDFIGTLGTFEESFPDAVAFSVLADRCRRFTKNQSISERDIKKLVSGLEIIVPDLLQTEGEKVVIAAHPNKLAEAINAQLQKVKAMKSGPHTS